MQGTGQPSGVGLSIYPRDAVPAAEQERAGKYIGQCMLIATATLVEDGKSPITHAQEYCTLVRELVQNRYPELNVELQMAAG
jgi:hypothetical protein